MPAIPLPGPSRELEEVEAVAVFRARSASSPGTWHYTFFLESGEFLCTCLGWKHNAKCWHVEQAAAHVEATIELSFPADGEFDVSL